MEKKRYSLSTLIYVFIIIALGILSAIFLFIFPSEREWYPWPFFFFGSLALVATSLSISFQEHLPSKGIIQISSSFVYALFFLIHPGGVAAILVLLPLYDHFFSKRKLLTALFNIGQLLISLAIISFIWLRVGSDRGLSILSAKILFLALFTLIIFSIINHLLTNIVIVLAAKKSFFKTGLLNKTALYNESAIITLGLSMASLWTLYPPLAVLSTVPIAILFLSLITMSKKESALTIRQAELASLNDLALEIGAEIDIKKLRHAIVRIASTSTHASAAVLAINHNNPNYMDICASYGFENDEVQPKKFTLSSENNIDKKDIYIGDNLSEKLFPECLQGRFTQYMALPIPILKEKESILCVLSGTERKSFDAFDAKKFKNLGRFIEIALSNATLYENLKQVQQQLIQSEKLSAVGMLVSGVTHELKSPLMSIIGYSDLLHSQAKEESFKRKLEEIAGEAQRAAKIVQNLLSFARESKLNKKLININALIEKVLEMKSYSFHANKIRVHKDQSSPLKDILADHTQIHQVLLNIINNAEDALKSKPDERIIDIKTFEEDGWIKVKISNNGPNIPEESLKKIFLPFFTTKELGKGAGLGLSICYGIIEEHKGKIAAVNKNGRGVTFSIKLPASHPYKEHEKSQKSL